MASAAFRNRKSAEAGFVFPEPDVSDGNVKVEKRDGAGRKKLANWFVDFVFL
jgi:hypothetical protein